MTTKPKELVAAERAWKEADRVYKTAAAATDSAHKLFREAKDLKNQSAAWRLLSRARSAEHTASIAWYKAEHALQSIAFRLEYPNPCGTKNPRPKKNGLPGEPPPGVYEWDPKKFPLPPDSYEIEKWRGGTEARKGNRPLIRINPCGVTNPAPSSIARGGKKLEELERKVGEAAFIWRADKSEKSRRALNRAMKALETYRREVGINPIENPAPRKLPGQAVLLGEAVELEVISDNGRRRTFKGAGAAALLSDADGDALAIVRPDATKDADPRRGSKDSASTWRKWSGFRVDGALLLTVTDRPLKFSLGTAIVIRYRSDKWTGKAAYYEHKFTSKDFHVWGDSASSPRAILITSFPPRRLVTARGIVG